MTVCFFLLLFFDRVTFTRPCFYFYDDGAGHGIIGSFRASASGRRVGIGRKRFEPKMFVSVLDRVTFHETICDWSKRVT